MRRTTEERFLSKVKKTKDCWLWKGSQSRGYGYFFFNGKSRIAHRVSYAMYKRKISKKMTLDHLCKNTLCVNPDHLEPVSLKENVLRGDGPCAKFLKRTHCKHGHKFDFKNTEIRIHNGRKSRVCLICRKLSIKKHNRIMILKRKRLRLLRLEKEVFG